MKVILILLFVFTSLYAETKYDVRVQLNPSHDIVKEITRIVKNNRDKSVYISLENATYTLASSASTKKQLLEFNKLKNFTFDANNSKLLIKKESVGFMFFNNSTNINISNMSIDYISRPKTHGKVIAIDKKRKEIVFEALSDDIDSLKNNLKNTTKRRIYGLVFEKPGIIKEWASPVTFIESIKHLKKRKYILKYKKLHNVKINDTFVIVFRYQSALFRMTNSNNLSFKNISIHSSPSGVFVGNRTSSTFFDNCNVRLKKGDYLSSNADVFHFQSSRIGPKITNCTLEGVGDDIVALYTKPMYVVKKISKKKLLVSKNNFLIKKGDGISFFNREIGKIVFISKVTNILKSKSNFIVEFEQKLPKDIKYKNIRLYDRETTNKGFLIKDSVFKNSRRHGCYIKAFDGKIINNTFINLGGSAVAIKNEPTWPEGLNSENILIKGNNMSNCGYGINRKQPLVEIKFLKMKGISKYNEHKNIVYEGNE